MERTSPPRRDLRPCAGAPRARAGSRGFTLIELIVVVIIVGVFAAMALPQVTLQLRDRRVQEAAQRIAMIYQQARMRAMGQGGAMLVRFSGEGVFETREALVGPGTPGDCEFRPSSSCTRTSWDTPAAGQYRSVQMDNIADADASSPTARSIFATLIPETASANATQMDVCYSPLGRAFVRYGTDPTTPFTALAGIPVFEIARRTASGQPAVGRVREVLVLPTGIARLAP